MNKDFFDEEFDRQVNQQQNTQDVGGWYTPPEPPQRKNNNKPLYVILVCVLLVVAFTLGWGLCVLTKSTKSSDNKALVQDALNNFKTIIEDNYGITISDEYLNEALENVISNSDQITASNQNQQLLLTVFQYLRDNYYFEDISEYEWEVAVANAGTALLQTAGDQFSYLMTPTQYLNEMYPETAPDTQTLTIYGVQTFGIVLNYTENVGINVSSVADDSSAFGRFQPGDQIVKISDMMGGQNPKAYADVLGNAVWVFDKQSNGEMAQTEISYDYIQNLYKQIYSNYADLGYKQEMFDGNSIVLNDFTYTQASYVLQTIYSATFHVLRNGEIVQIPLVRGVTGNTTVNPDYDMEYVEFYFGDNLTNISTTPLNNSTISVKQDRHLQNLPANTGYIRLIQFETEAFAEMKTALELFKNSGLTHLVLDLKGNPGGYVSTATQIAGLFVDTMYLTDAQLAQVSADGNKKLMTELVYRDGTSDRYTNACRYNDYFALPTGNTKNIVVWTDGNSASASEMLTGVILDYQTGIQMGTRTYGKGIAQTIERLDFVGKVRDDMGNATTYTVKTSAGSNKIISEYNWAIYYTCAQYNSPLGTNIHGAGYTPQAQFDGLATYEQLVQAVNNYWQ